MTQFKVESMKLTIVGWFAALATMAVLLAIPFVMVFVIMLVFGL